jgi:hypothetical protein
MKTLLLTLMLAGFAMFHSKAQSVVVDTFTINGMFVERTDSIDAMTGSQIIDTALSLLPFDSLSTGLLVEHCELYGNYNHLNGDSLSDSNYTDYKSHLNAYHLVFQSALDTNALPVPHPDSFHRVVQFYLDSGLIPISLFNYELERIKPNALTDSILVWDGENNS